MARDYVTCEKYQASMDQLASMTSTTTVQKVCYTILCLLYDTVFYSVYLNIRLKYTHQRIEPP